jgi:hypothetical protein
MSLLLHGPALSAGSQPLQTVHAVAMVTDSKENKQQDVLVLDSTCSLTGCQRVDGHLK